MPQSIFAASKAGPAAAEVQRILPSLLFSGGIKRAISEFVPMSARRMGAFAGSSQLLHTESALGDGKPAESMEHIKSAPIKAPTQGGK